LATRRQTFRLYPNKKQERRLFEARRNHAYLYNACVAHRRYEWRAFQKSVTYFEQQNCLPAFKKEWVEFASLHSQAMQATVKRVDLAYGAFFQGLRRVPKFKSIRNYSGWTYPAKSGWKVNSNGKHGAVTLNDLGLTLKMRGQAKQWGIPTTLTIGCLSSTDLTKKRKHTSSMKQLGQRMRQKLNREPDGELETPSVYTAG
jgi:putative transposase